VLSLFIEGVVLGIVPVFFVGPVLFTLLDASLQNGFRAGALVALGIAVSDVVAITLCAIGLGPVLTDPTGQLVLELVGGVILLGFGAVLAIRATHVDNSGQGIPVAHPFLAGFLVNFVNPFVFSFWVGVLGGLGGRQGWTPEVLVPMFGGMVTTILLTDIAKAAAASRLSRHLSGPVLTWARRVSGLLLITAGTLLLLRRLASPLVELR